MNKPLLLLSLPALALAGCNTELFEAGAVMGSNEIEIFPLTLLDVAPFFCSCALAAALLVQPFIPLLRKLYAACWRFLIDLLGINSQRAEKAQLLGTGLAWLGFCGGISLLPLCLALHEDTFHPIFSGPFNFGYASFAFILMSVPLALASFVIVSVVSFFRWRALTRAAKTGS